MKEEQINLVCEKCSMAYEKPLKFKEWNNKHSNVFFRMSLTMCDTCRRKKEIEYLKELPTVLNALSKINP